MKAERLRRLEDEFKTLGRILRRQETLKSQLDAAICFGLAEVCRLLRETYATQGDPADST